MEHVSSGFLIMLRDQNFERQGGKWDSFVCSLGIFSEQLPPLSAQSISLKI